jgi:hypothetical protein
MANELKKYDGRPKVCTVILEEIEPAEPLAWGCKTEDMFPTPQGKMKGRDRGEQGRED